MAYTTTAKTLFDQVIPGQLAAASAPLRKVGGVIEFDIEGADGGHWWVDLNRGTVGSTAQKPDCIVRAQARDFMALVEGRMSFSDGLLTERLAVAGPAGHLTRLFEAIVPAAPGR